MKDPKTEQIEMYKKTILYNIALSSLKNILIFSKKKYAQKT